MNSPWGKIQHVTKVTRGISWVSCAGHGGLRVSRKSHEHKLHPLALKQQFVFIEKDYIYFEEDIAWSFAVICLRDIEQLNGLRDTAHDACAKWYPDIYKAITSEVTQ